MKDQISIGVVGAGTVGHATARCWMEHGEVRVYDQIRERRTHELPEVMSCDFIFVCLPENAVEPFLTDYRGWQKVIIIKSTVPIGTTKRLAQELDLPNLLHSPEFLTARCAVTDAQLPARNIIGVPSRWNGETDIAVLDLYQQRFPGVPIYWLTSDESEAVKLIQNSFFAVKISFFNEARSLCDKLELDWQDVLSAVLADGRIAHAHTAVPGPDGERGYGGKCLVKDIKQFIECFEVTDAVPLICDAAQRRNFSDRPSLLDEGI